MKKLSVEAMKALLLPMQEEMSEGEAFIRDFLEEEDIKYEREFEIKGLTGDTKAYRVADFYLPKYALYIEFLGNWNTSPEHRERYREKMSTYYRNEIACVYLFPDNLGTLEHIFRRRSRVVLTRLQMRKELFRFNLKWFWNECENHVLIALFIGFLGALLHETDVGSVLLVVSGVIWALIAMDLRRHFMKVPESQLRIKSS